MSSIGLSTGPNRGIPADYLSTRPNVPERDARDRQAPRTTHDGRIDPHPAIWGSGFAREFRG